MKKKKSQFLFYIVLLPFVVVSQNQQFHDFAVVLSYNRMSFFCNPSLYSETDVQSNKFIILCTIDIQFVMSKTSHVLRSD